MTSNSFNRNIFTDYEQASFRQYQRLTKALKPDKDAYEQEKQHM